MCSEVELPLPGGRRDVLSVSIRSAGGSRLGSQDAGKAKSPAYDRSSRVEYPTVSW